MSQQVRGQDPAGGTGNTANVHSDGALYVSQLGAGIASGGRFSVATKSGALTPIGAIGGGTNGQCWSARFTTTTTGKLAIIERITAQFTTTVGASTAQETGISIFRATAFTAQCTGGAAVTLTTPAAKLRVSETVPEMLVQFSNSTGQLTAGTHTLDTQPLAEKTAWCLAAAATVQMPIVDLDLDLTGSPLVLATNEGILIGPAVTQANSLAQVLRVRMVWREVLSYPQ